MGAPTVVIDDLGAEVLYVDLEHPRIDWWQVREIAIEVVAAPELGYAEAFWSVVGEGINWGAPVELIVGADVLRSRLFAFPDFDVTVYQRARQAEAAGKAETFVCWRAASE
jgi:hypothetical protein